MKAAHSADTKGISGPTRSHIISRLHKASSTVDELLITIDDRSNSGATDTDILEARAYVTSLSGAEEFEKQSWEACVKNYSEAWVLYSALSGTLKSDLVKELLAGTIEQSIRYAAYQLRMPRTVAVPAIARKYFPRTDPALTSAVEKLDPSILKDSVKAKTGIAELEAGSRTITWRSRTVEVEDASISAALASADQARSKLSNALTTIPTTRPKERAAAYDDLLIASQDAVDAAKHAIDELVAEGVPQGDKRIQSLQITRTAVSYDLISWRMGRNRVLTGEQDGTSLDSSPIANTRIAKKARTTSVDRDEGAGRRLARLREKLVMYDSTLQSLETIKELPGIAADASFLDEIEAKHHYFRALKCLAIARSHSVLSEHSNALALVVRASALLVDALGSLSTASVSPAGTPPNISISSDDARALSDLLAAETQRLRGLVELTGLTGGFNPSTSTDLPLVQRLTTYPANGVDLKNLVSYPPKLQPVPVKPLFFDVAWNFIEYPGQAKANAVPVTSTPANQVPEDSKQQPQQKKSWFGFGR